MLCPAFYVFFFDKIQPGKYLPGRFLNKIVQNVGHNIDFRLQILGFGA